MKLLRAEFKNFRLLRDLELTFSSDQERCLTVIRAANESGKTTILHALQWALYGDDSLPGKGNGFRLYPIDWDGKTGARIPITVSVDFECTSYRQTARGLRETRRQYRIVRSAHEEIEGRRTPSTVALFALDDIGATPINEPDALINEELPPELRDVFFTDGDRALSFIEADVAQSTKRERVQRAIRALLGLGVIDNALRHVRKAGSEVNKKAKELGANTDLNRIAAKLEEIEVDIEKRQTDLDDKKQQFEEFDGRCSETDHKIAAALKKGDKEKLSRQIEDARREKVKLEKQLAEAIKEHSLLFRGQAIASDLLVPVLKPAHDKLEEMHDQGRIPNTTIPVLEQRLHSESCICGESLDSRSQEGQRRRKHIEKLIEDSRRADEIQEIVTDLYYGSKPPQPKEPGSQYRWLEDYGDVVRRRDGIDELRGDAGRKLASLEAELDSIPDIDIQGLRETLRQYRQQRDRCLQQASSIETELRNLRRQRDELAVERDRLLKDQRRGARLLAELNIVQDVTGILDRAYHQITDEELSKVSDRMNEIFLGMIGADPNQGAIIREAEIDKEFDITVWGPNRRALNPDRDLNGASRRALTLAFILALTKVSEVEAPNVIDTPLGMTAGFVKKSILRSAIRESSQLILFLTHDEIMGCEDIIDQHAGSVYTLTNPAHYPKMLLHDPGIAERQVVRCECNHRDQCNLCERRTDVEPAAVED